MIGFQPIMGTPPDIGTTGGWKSIFGLFKGIKNLKRITNVIKSVDDLINAAGELRELRKGGPALEGTVTGDIEEIFKAITKGATKITDKQFKLADGTFVVKKVLEGEKPTIYINKAGQLYKIRIMKP